MNDVDGVCVCGMSPCLYGSTAELIRAGVMAGTCIWLEVIGDCGEVVVVVLVQQRLPSCQAWIILNSRPHGSPAAVVTQRIGRRSGWQRWERNEACYWASVGPFLDNDICRSDPSVRAGMDLCDLPDWPLCSRHLGVHDKDDCVLFEVISCCEPFVPTLQSWKVVTD